MPNWCEGVLKIRGKKKNLIDFFQNGIVEFIYDNDFTIKYIPLALKFDSEYDSISFNSKNGHDLYVYGTSRMFLKNLSFEFYFDEDEEVYNIFAIDVMQAWRIKSDDLVKISKKYGVDFRIKAFEKGIQFSQEVEVIDGKITIDTEIEYKNYQWEVYDPRLGG